MIVADVEFDVLVTVGRSVHVMIVGMDNRVKVDPCGPGEEVHGTAYYTALLKYNLEEILKRGNPPAHTVGKTTRRCFLTPDEMIGIVARQPSKERGFDQREIEVEKLKDDVYQFQCVVGKDVSFRLNVDRLSLLQLIDNLTMIRDYGGYRELEGRKMKALNF